MLTRRRISFSFFAFLQSIQIFIQFYSFSDLQEIELFSELQQFIINRRKLFSQIEKKLMKTPHPTKHKDAKIFALKPVEQVSSLYSQHIYKSTHRNFVYQAQMEKLKTLYEMEKNSKKKLIKDLALLKVKLEKMANEREILSFALDTLSCKLDQETAEKSKLLLDKLLSETKQNNSSLESNLNQSQRKNPYMNQSKRKLIHHLKNNFNFQPTLNNKRNRSNDQFGSEIFIQEDDESEIAKKKVTDLENKIKEQENQFEKMTKILAEKQQHIFYHKTHVHSLTLSVTQKQQQVHNLKFEVISLKQQLQEKNQSNQILSKKSNEQLRRITQLELQIKLTQEEYEEREEKQRQNVQMLQKFSRQLKLNDQKVREFLNSEFQQYCGEEYCSSQRTYQEHLSYILHLYKKKEQLYEGLLEQLKERMRQSQLRLSIHEKKLTSFYECLEKVKKYLKDRQVDKKQNAFFENINKIIEFYNF